MIKKQQQIATVNTSIQVGSGKPYSIFRWLKNNNKLQTQTLRFKLVMATLIHVEIESLKAKHNDVTKS